MAISSGTAKNRFVLRCMGFARGLPCPHVGDYVRFFDHEASDGQGHAWFTPEISQAQQFRSTEEALEFYKRVPKCKPVREDGQPNRPLTAMNVEICTLPIRVDI